MIFWSIFFFWELRPKRPLQQYCINQLTVMCDELSTVFTIRDGDGKVQILESNIFRNEKYTLLNNISNEINIFICIHTYWKRIKYVKMNHLRLYMEKNKSLVINLCVSLFILILSFIHYFFFFFFFLFKKILINFNIKI